MQRQHGDLSTEIAESLKVFGLQGPTLSRHHPQPVALEPDVAFLPMGDLRGEITPHNKAEFKVRPSSGGTFKRGDGVWTTQCLVDAHPWVVDGHDQGLKQLTAQLKGGIVAFHRVVASPGRNVLKVI